MLFFVLFLLLGFFFFFLLFFSPLFFFFDCLPPFRHCSAWNLLASIAVLTAFGSMQIPPYIYVSNDNFYQAFIRSFPVLLVVKLDASYPKGVPLAIIFHLVSNGRTEKNDLMCSCCGFLHASSYAWNKKGHLIALGADDVLPKLYPSMSIGLLKVLKLFTGIIARFHAYLIAWANLQQYSW